MYVYVYVSMYVCVFGTCLAAVTEISLRWSQKKVNAKFPIDLIYVEWQQFVLN